MIQRYWMPALIGCGLLSCTTVGMASQQDNIERGAYLARAGDCVACHTAPKGKPFAGGLEIESPLGTIVSSNITPDPETGIGHYSKEEFAAALRKGKRADGANLYPAMPYPSYAKLTDDDISDLYAYFMEGVEPVANKPPESELRFPFSQRWGIRVWNWVFTDSGTFTPSHDQSDQIARGAYLVQGAGHCGSCHTPRGFAFQEKALDDSKGAYLTGETLNGWWAPNLRGGGDGNSGLQKWSADDIVDYLATGRNDHSAVVGEMTSVVANSTSHMNDEDLHAMAAYLKSLPRNADSDKATASETTPEQTEKMLTAADVEGKPGARLYLDNCNACHFANGLGAPQTFPSLVDNELVNANDATGLIHVMLAGARLPSTPGKLEALAMPDFGWRLSDEEAAQLATFVRGAWGNHGGKVTADQVAEVRKALPENHQSSKPDFVE